MKNWIESFESIFTARKATKNLKVTVCLKSNRSLVDGIGIHVKGTNSEMGYVLNF